MFESSSSTLSPLEKLPEQNLRIIAARLKNWDSELELQNLKIVTMQPITWINGALGCPIPGKYYIQSNVPGYLIWLRYKNNLIEVHTDQSLYTIAMPGIGFI